MLVAIAIPIFTTQLEKARVATDQANIRAAYAEAAVDMLDNDKTSTSGTTGPITWNASVSGDTVTLSTSGTFKSNTYSGKTVTFTNGSFTTSGG